MKRSVDELALFGGPPLFTPFRSTAQLANPGVEAFFAYARQAFERRRLTNQGPLVKELETQLAAYHGVKHCIACANACLGIVLALRALAGEQRGNVVLPAMSFRGLPHLVRWAGLVPRYCEIDPVRHTLDPAALAATITPETIAILAVDNVNALCEIDRIEPLAHERGIPLLLDSVYGIGGRYGGDPVGTRGSATVFTLHATKLVNGFEGGYITTDDDRLARVLRAQRNFGFMYDRSASLLGMNAKLNEIHAGLALANFGHIDKLMVGNQARFEAYQRHFADLEGLGFADYTFAPRNYSLVLMKFGHPWPFTRDEMEKVLRAEKALVRAYYAPALYRVDADYPRGGDRFPVADEQSRLFLQMPGGEMMSEPDIAALAELFRFVRDNAGDIRKRMRADADG